MKKILMLILMVLFIASLPIFVHADGVKMHKEGFNKYTPDSTPAVEDNGYWKNEYYPQHHRKTMNNVYGYAVRNQHRKMTYYQRHNYYNYRMNRYFLRCY